MDSLPQPVPGASGTLSRRAFLAGGLAGAGLAVAGGLPPAAARAQVPEGIRPRVEWAGDLAPQGVLEAEAARDVRFLLVHHSASANTYAPGDVPGILRSFYHHHTGAKGWPDIAYNFLVDRFGTVWEGRAGSLERPVKGDATGGSQGFALLACLIGDHSTQAPTPEAVDALARLLAGLARRYGIDPAPGARASFTSRGSDNHPVGAAVETATIAGHRDMSETACPGDAAYALVTGELPARVAELQRALSEPGTEPTAQGPSTPAPPAAATRHTLAVSPDRAAASAPPRYWRLRSALQGNRPR